MGNPYFSLHHSRALRLPLPMFGREAQGIFKVLLPPATIESRLAHTEQFHGFGTIASRLVECSQKLGTCVVVGAEYKRRDRSIRLGSTDFRKQVSGIDPPAFAADRGEFDHILEFVDVAGPGIGEVSG